MIKQRVKKTRYTGDFHKKEILLINHDRFNYKKNRLCQVDLRKLSTKKLKEVQNIK